MLSIMYQFSEPSFSPDGKFVVFEASKGSGEEHVGSIWKVNIDNGKNDSSILTSVSEFTELSPKGLNDWQPNWSPKQDKILFQRNEGNDIWNIYTISPDGTEELAVTNGSDSNTDASWSPDGRFIVYSSNYKNLRVPNIFIILSTGGIPIRITKNSVFGDGAASWSPDSEWIYFESHRGSEDTPASLWRIAVPTQFK